MFWIAAAVLTGVTCLALLTALRGEAVSADHHDKAFYEAQIAEIDRQLSLGLIGEKEAVSARTEAARRLLASASPVLNPTEDSPAILPSRRLAAVLTLLAIPLIALPVYYSMGSPGMPGFPLTSRSSSPVDPSGATQQAGLDVAKALEQIEAHLLKNPDDGKGHEVIGPVYMRIEKYDEAVKAFDAALRLLGPTAERHFNLGEALVFQSRGAVTPKAASAFEAAVALESSHLKAQFFLALAAQQEGNLPRARSILSSIRDRLPEGELKQEIDRQLASIGAVPRGGEGIAALPLGEQQAAIRSMVEGLATRLATSGGSVEDWARLVRALTVLGEADRVKAIVAEARLKFADQPEQLKLIEQASGGVQP